MTAEPDLPPNSSSAEHHYNKRSPATVSHDAPDGRRPESKLGSLFPNLALRCAHVPKTSVNAFCGAAAGIASGIVTCPLDVIKTRLQTQDSFRPRTHPRPTRAVYNGLVGTARIIWSHDGFRGMYRGLGPMLLGYVPTWATYMSVYDIVKESMKKKTSMCWRLALVIGG